jgi:hypothetical protein
LSLRKDSGGFSQEQTIDADLGGLYYFRSDEAQRVRISPSRRIHAPLADGKAEVVTLHEGEMVRLRLSERITSKENQAGDQVRLESAEDVYEQPACHAAEITRRNLAPAENAGSSTRSPPAATSARWTASDPAEGMISRNPPVF